MRTVLLAHTHTWVQRQEGSARTRRGGRMPPGGSVVEGAAEGRCLIEKPKDYKRVSGVALGRSRSSIAEHRTTRAT
eukprot:4293837-Pyramimonas_sp.AAC.1